MARIHGHEHAMETLREAMRNDRLHHAWIVSGPVGVGKRTLAVELARVLLDPEARPDDLGTDRATPRGQAATLLAAGTHPDLHIVRRELAATSENPRLRERKQINIPIDLLRETMLGGRTSDDRMHEAPAYRTAMLGGNKMFIIDEAERLDLPGQNFLLKTLEEPPAGTFIVLVTARPERLLPTVRSRCQHLRLGALDDDSISLWLSESGLELDEAARETAITFAQGAPGMIELAVKRDLFSWFDTLGPLLRELDAGGWPDQGAQQMATCIENWSQSAIDENPRASKEAANREGAEMLMRLLGNHLRRRLHESVDDPPACVVTCRRIDRVAQAEAQVHAGLNLKHVLEGMTAQWSVA